MELKQTVGISVAVIVVVLIFMAGGKNDYKKSKNMFPFCIPIVFTGHEICIRPHIPKSSKKVRTR